MSSPIARPSKDEQIARCDREIERCRSYQEDDRNPLKERQLANMGEVDWMVAKLYIEELDQ